MSTFTVLNPCGLIVHQTYNQLYPAADVALADQARDKNLLGYHDIRTGNQPDARLMKFIGTNLPRVLPESRQKFEDHKDLIEGFVTGETNYDEFAARVRRRREGTDEDNDWKS
ncbi:MAG: hypothetical protein WAW96_08260 [Alphaproteobacteria bacterium]